VTIAQALWSVSKGVLILGIAGTFWLGVGLGPGSYRIGIAPWLAVLAAMVLALVAFVRAAQAIGRRSGFRRSDLDRRDPATRRILAGFGVIGALEALLVISAVWLCKSFGHPDLVLPAIALAVSLHFAPLAHLLGVPAYYVTAVAGTVIASAVMLAPVDGSRQTWLGAGMAIVTWATAIHLVRHANAIAAASVASSEDALAEPTAASQPPSSR